MKKTELLEFMDKEQLVKVVNSLIDKNKNLENQLKKSEELIETKRNTEDNMLKDMIDKNKELEECAEISSLNFRTLESIATEVNRSTIFFKDMEKDELITFKNRSNIIDRLEDRFNKNKDGLLIDDWTKKPF